uniref:Uncharacterized protein n=1 Tax=Ditylenchus dipsaci TaxID=166011 RepID=A0A915DPT4_9BILA
MHPLVTIESDQKQDFGRPNPNNNKNQQNQTPDNNSNEFSKGGHFSAKPYLNRGNHIEEVAKPVWPKDNSYRQNFNSNNNQQGCAIAMPISSCPSSERRYTLSEVIFRVVGFFGLIFVAIMFFYIASVLDDKDKTTNKHIDCLKGQLNH